MAVISLLHKYQQELRKTYYIRCSQSHLLLTFGFLSSEKYYYKTIISTNRYLTWQVNKNLRPFCPKNNQIPLMFSSEIIKVVPLADFSAIIDFSISSEWCTWLSWLVHRSSSTFGSISHTLTSRLGQKVARNLSKVPIIFEFKLAFFGCKNTFVKTSYSYLID